MLDWLRRFFQRAALKPTAPTPPRPPMSAEELSEAIQDHIDTQVAGGFLSRDDIIKTTGEYLEGEADPVVIERQAIPLVDLGLRRHADEQRNWTLPTDCDRLDSAFAELESAGIISRQDYTCCGTCGASEIWGEMDDAMAAGRPSRGYAFYHMQDTESAVQGAGLYLNYGAREEGEDAALAVGHEIVEHLERHGLKTRWDGDLSRRIHIAMDWKRRR